VSRRIARAAEIDNAFGAMVTAAEPDGPAAAAGLMAYDIIVRLDGETVTGVDDLIRLLNGERIGLPIAVEALRRGRLNKFQLVPRERRNERKSE
jgi:S1-C subfamily serine protease